MTASALLVMASIVTMLATLSTAAHDASCRPLLTEDEAVRRAVSHVAITELAAGRVGVARAEELRERRWDDPELSLERERTRGDAGATQDFVTLSQSVDLSGRRRLRGDAAGHRARATDYRNDGWRIGYESDVRQRYHELLAAQLRAGLARVFVTRIDDALEITSRRVAAGDAATYDRLRLERARGNARSRQSVHDAESVVAWARLGALMGASDAAVSGDGPPELVGTLLPTTDADVEVLLARLEARPDILALDAEMAAAEREAEAASRWWLPQPTLSAGWTGMESSGDDIAGYVVAIALSVPVFDRKRDESLRAISQARVADGNRQLVLMEARALVRGHVGELIELVDAAQRFRVDVVSGSCELIRIAEAGYAGDELGVLELLDAHRGAFDDELTAIDLELRARGARIELDRITGGDAP